MLWALAGFVAGVVMRPTLEDWFAEALGWLEHWFVRFPGA